MIKNVKTWYLLTFTAITLNTFSPAAGWWSSVSLFGSPQVSVAQCNNQHLSPIIAGELAHSASGTTIVEDQPFSARGCAVGLVSEGYSCKRDANELEISDADVSLEVENPVKSPTWRFAEDGREYDPTFGISAGISATSLASLIQHEETIAAAGDAKKSIVGGGRSALGISAFGLMSRAREKVGRFVQSASTAANYARKGRAACEKLVRVAKCLNRASNFVLTLDKKIAQYAGEIEVFKRHVRVASLIGLSWASYIALKRL